MASKLTHEEELILIKDRDNKKSLDRLVLSNLGLVHKIVHKFPLKSVSCNYEDLFQEGVAGLIHAIHKFEVERGYRLSTYSYRWIQAYITRYYQNQGRTIRVPVHMATKQMELNKQVESLTRDLGRTPTQEEIEDVNSNVDWIKTSMVPVSSLNQLVSETDELECLQGDDNTEESDRKMDCDILLERVKQVTSDRDYNILSLRYGLDGNQPHTLSEISELHGLTRARVHQITNQMIRQCREMVTT